MSPKAINNKIADLDFWLVANPEHPDYSMMLKQKREYQFKLSQIQVEKNE